MLIQASIDRRGLREAIHVVSDQRSQFPMQLGKFKSKIATFITSPLQTDLTTAFLGLREVHTQCEHYLCGPRMGMIISITLHLYVTLKCLSP